MCSDVLPTVAIHTSPEEVPSVPPWFAEVVLLARYFTQQGHLDAISQHVRLARGRAGIFDVLDFVAILLGYAVSGEATLEAFFDRLAPFAQPFMALFGRDQLPHRATLSRFLAAVDPPCRDALRQRFEEDLLKQGVSGEAMGGFWGQQGQRLVVIDVDGTRQAARQRALATCLALPPAQRRLDAVCAPGYTGRKRGEVVRTRTTVLQAHTQEWLGSFSSPGNGDYALELEAACRVTAAYLAERGLAPDQALLRLDGLYGSLGPLARIQPFQLGFLTRGRDYQLLDHPVVQARLQHPPDGTVTHLESQVQRELFDAGFIADWLPERPEVVISYRVLVTRRAAPADQNQITVGKLRDEHVYELFLTSHPASNLPAATVLELYQHRGAFEQVLSDEDEEQDPDRWCSRTPCGQEFWQILSQWVWNVRVRLGLLAQPQPLRWTSWEAGSEAPAWAEMPEPSGEAAAESQAAPPALEGAQQPIDSEELVPTYGPLTLSQPWAKARRRFSAQAFELQEDDTLVCPQGKVLRPRERRVLETGDLRVLYAAKAHDCRTCPQAGDCLGRGASGEQPRRVSGVRRRTGWQVPPSPATAPAQPLSPQLQKDAQEQPTFRWCDCGGRRVRRDLVVQLRRQHVTLRKQEGEPTSIAEQRAPRVWTKAERAHRRHTWANRLARNAYAAASSSWSVSLPGVSAALAAALGLPSTSVS